MQQLRRCIVCSRSDDRWQLARFWVRDGAVGFDLNSDTEGRGVYLHRTLQCFSSATELRVWKRSLGRKGADIDHQRVLRAVDDARRTLKIFSSV
jgi:predicted RNA-binding protein YlxR (DUF448 family)